MSFLKLVIKALASGLGTGYSPLAPGTVGSLLAALISWIFIPSSGWAMLLLLIAAFPLGVLISTQAEKWWGQDPPRVVIDEMVGQWLSLWLLPKNIFIFIISFVFFRLFDILKPWGVDRLQDLPRGLGVMADDLLAGFYSNLFMQTLVLIFYKEHSLLAGFWR